MKINLAGNPFIQMWARPRKTLEEILKKDNRYGFLILSFFYGFVHAVQFCQVRSFGDTFNIWMNLFLILVFSIPLGAAYYYVSAFFYYWTGKLIGGKGSFTDIRCAICWSNVTQIVSTILIIMMLALFNNLFFKRAFVEQSYQNWELVFVIIFLVGEVILSIWTFILFVGSIAAAHRFSIWMSLLNIFIVSLFYIGLVFIFEKLTTFGGETISLIGRSL